MSSQHRRLAVIASTIGVLAVGAPAGAFAATASKPAGSDTATDSTPAVSVPCGAGPLAGGFTTPLGLTFVPPAVGPIGVSIAPTILDGKMTSPGLHVTTPGTGGGFPSVACDTGPTTGR